MPSASTIESDALASKLVRRGWVCKSHRGSPFAKHRLRRFLVSDGFHVQYFADEALRHRCGRFDLRNVLCLRASTDPDCKNGLDVLLSEGHQIPPKPTKIVLLDFGSADALSLWLPLWTSAVALEHVDESLGSHRDPQLAATFNAVRGGESPLRSTSRLSSKTPLLSPREGRHQTGASLPIGLLPLAGANCTAGEELLSPREASESEAGFDTPRGCAAVELSGPHCAAASPSALSLRRRSSTVPAPEELTKASHSLAVRAMMDTTLPDAIEQADPLGFADVLERTERRAHAPPHKTGLGPRAARSVSPPPLPPGLSQPSPSPRVASQ